jgi:hypothetical protein
MPAPAEGEEEKSSGLESAVTDAPRFSLLPGGVLGGTGCELLRAFREPCALRARLS